MNMKRNFSLKQHEESMSACLMPGKQERTNFQNQIYKFTSHDVPLRAYFPMELADIMKSIRI